MTAATARRGLLGTVAALAAVPAVATAIPAAAVSMVSPDAELIALLEEAARLRREWDVAPTTSPWRSDDPWHAAIVAACAIPARTPEGIRAKAAALQEWVCSDTPQERIALSLAADLLGGTH